MSPIDNTPPQGKKQPARTDFRLRELERARVAAQALTPAQLDPFPGFSSLSVIALGDIANIWEAQLAHSYTEALISAVSTGGSTSSFDLELNGSSLLTLSLLAGEVRHLYVAVFSVAAGDRLGGTVTAAGGHIAVSVQLRETL